MTKRLKITDLIAKKEEIKKASKIKKRIDLELSEHGGAVVTIEEPERSLVLDTMEAAQDETYEGNADADMVYAVMVEPNLKDKELQKEYGCAVPTDIVEILFSPGTITSIAKEALALAGYTDDVKVVKDLKN